MTEAANEKGLYDWKGDEENCPEDIVVNTSKTPVILSADGQEEVRRDGFRIEQGDRRQGRYYVEMTKLEINTGIQLVKGMNVERLLELEDIRQRRTGEKPPKWVEECRRRAAEGHDPQSFDNVAMARSNLSIASRRW